jgi:hypothetical protein
LQERYSGKEFSIVAPGTRLSQLPFKAKKLYKNQPKQFIRPVSNAFAAPVQVH